jgi:hypothetical protein
MSDFEASMAELHQVLQAKKVARLKPVEVQEELTSNNSSRQLSMVG